MQTSQEESDHTLTTGYLLPDRDKEPQVYAGLCAGMYTVTITDATGCSSVVDIPVSSTNGPDLAMTFTPVVCNGACDGTADVTASGGSGNYTYLLGTWRTNYK